MSNSGRSRCPRSLARNNSGCHEGRVAKRSGAKPERKRDESPCRILRRMFGHSTLSWFQTVSFPHGDFHQSGMRNVPYVATRPRNTRRPDRFSMSVPGRHYARNPSVHAFDLAPGLRLPLCRVMCAWSDCLHQRVLHSQWPGRVLKHRIFNYHSFCCTTQPVKC